jgi:hypothetical protein
MLKSACLPLLFLHLLICMSFRADSKQMATPCNMLSLTVHSSLQPPTQLTHLLPTCMTTHPLTCSHPTTCPPNAPTHPYISACQHFLETHSHVPAAHAPSRCLSTHPRFTSPRSSIHTKGTNDSAEASLAMTNLGRVLTLVPAAALPPMSQRLSQHSTPQTRQRRFRRHSPLGFRPSFRLSSRPTPVTRLNLPRSRRHRLPQRQSHQPRLGRRRRWLPFRLRQTLWGQ